MNPKRTGERLSMYVDMLLANELSADEALVVLDTLAYGYEVPVRDVQAAFIFSLVATIEELSLIPGSWG